MYDEKIDNDLYHISIDHDRNWIYFTMKTAYTDNEADRNITTNFLSHCYEYMDPDFKLILDLSMYDPRIKPEKFGERMKSIARRLEELNAGEQVHVMNDIHWANVYNKYPDHDGEYPLILTDSITGKLIGRFNTVAEGEDWLLSL